MNKNIDIDNLLKHIELKEPKSDLTSKIMLRVKKAERRQKILATLYQFISISVYFVISIYTLHYFDELKPIFESFSFITNFWGFIIPISFLIWLKFFFDSYFANLKKEKL